MPCEFLRNSDGEFVGIVCSRGDGYSPMPCSICGATHSALCDVCDEPICDEHATRVAHDTDVCPRHNTPDWIKAAIKRRLKLGG